MSAPKLTSSQQAAVLYFEGDSAILAGAGSGKTTVLVEKIATLVEKLHVPLQRVLVVTFTEKAAGEMKERIAKRLGSDVQDLSSLPMGTIHAAAADLLRRFGAPLGISPEFKIMNEFLSGLERLRAVREKFIGLINDRHPGAFDAVEHLGLRGSLTFFGKLLQKAPAAGDVPYASVYREIRSTYQERKASLQRLDFDDLEQSLLALLESNAAEMSALFDWIVVDEFQDTSPIQWEILSRLHDPKRNRLVVVGDPRQSIYRFRRADPKLFLKVARDIQKNQGRLFHLNENFRSAPEVIEFVNLVSEPLFEESFPPLVATRHDLTGKIDRLSVPVASFARETRAAEAKAVVEHLQGLRAQGVLWKSMTLLFRTRLAVPHYTAVLKEKNIPFRTAIGESLLERPEIIAMTFLLRRYASPTDKESATIETALSHSPLAGFAADLEIQPLTAFFESLFEKAILLFPEDVRRNLLAFKDLLLDLISLNISDLKALLENLATLRDEEARISCPAPEVASGPKDALTLMTVHASKGLEFPVIILCDLASRSAAGRTRGTFLESAQGDVVLKDRDKSAAGLKESLVKGDIFSDLERREKDEEFEESKRLLYVALTRARERIVLPLPLEKKERKGQTQVVTWSDWLIP